MDLHRYTSCLHGLHGAHITLGPFRLPYDSMLGSGNHGLPRAFARVEALSRLNPKPETP